VLHEFLHFYQNRTACESNKIPKIVEKITTRLICLIIVHFLELDDKLNCLLGTIQSSFSKLPHNNYNNIEFFNSFWKHYMKTYFCLKYCQKIR
jgi:hypothetical protein